MVASSKKVAYTFGIAVGVFLILRALFLPGPLEVLAFPPNTKVKAAYLEQVRHWDGQIRAMEAAHPGDVTTYRADPDQADPIFRTYYENSFRSYNLAMILLSLSFGAGVGICGVMAYRWRRAVVRASGRKAGAGRDAIVVLLSVLAVLVSTAYLLDRRFNKAAEEVVSSESDGVSSASRADKVVTIGLHCAMLGQNVAAEKEFVATLESQVGARPEFRLANPATEVLKCSIRIAHGRARITAQLTRGDVSLWGKTYDRPVSELDTIVGEIVAQVAQAHNP